MSRVRPCVGGVTPAVPLPDSDSNRHRWSPSYFPTPLPPPAPSLVGHPCPCPCDSWGLRSQVHVRLRTGRVATREDRDLGRRPRGSTGVSHSLRVDVGPVVTGLTGPRLVYHPTPGQGSISPTASLGAGLERFWDPGPSRGPVTTRVPSCRRDPSVRPPPPPPPTPRRGHYGPATHVVSHPVPAVPSPQDYPDPRPQDRYLKEVNSENPGKTRRIGFLRVVSVYFGWVLGLALVRHLSVGRRLPSHSGPFDSVDSRPRQVTPGRLGVARDPGTGVFPKRGSDYLYRGRLWVGRPRKEDGVHGRRVRTGRVWIPTTPGHSFRD